MISRELVQERMQSLHGQNEEAKTNLEEHRQHCMAAEADLFAIGGALQDCDFWLQDLNRMEADAEVARIAAEKKAAKEAAKLSPPAAGA